MSLTEELAPGTPITQERLKELLSYAPETGVFRWRVRRPNATQGSMAGAIQTNGATQIKVDNRSYLAHRLAWLYTQGTWPESEIDHIDGDRTNNRLENLREATRIENLCNIGLRSDNTTCYKGVNLHKGKFLARAMFNGKRTHLGYFPTAELASAAYQAFAKANHGEFYRPPT